MISRSWLISLSCCLLVAACAPSIPLPDIQTTVTRGHIPIECGEEPPVDQVSMLPVVNLEIFDIQGEQWVPLSNAIARYEALSLNLAQMTQSYQQRIAQLHFLRRCIETFNKRAEAAREETAQ